MKKFRKRISLVLSTVMLCLQLAVPVSAQGGYIDNMGEADDKLVGEPVSPYIVTQTDLSDASGTTSNGTTTWGIYDSGEQDHGKVYVIPSADWWARENGNMGVTYTYNYQEFNLFDEPLETDTYYILSYDYKSLPNDSSKMSDGSRFYFAPMVDTYKFGTDDYRDYPPASDNRWTKYVTVFNSGSQTEFNGKINTAATYTTSYIDNIKLVKATKLELNNLGDVKLSLDGTGLMYSEKLGGYFAELGEPVTIKAEGDNLYEKIVAVTHGSNSIVAEDGAYTIPAVSAGISVKYGLKIDSIEENAGVVINDNTVYTDCGDTYTEFLSKFGFPENVIEFYTKDGEKQSDFLKAMAPGLIAKVVYNEEELRNYSIKYYGDLYCDGELNVSDIVVLAGEIITDSVEDTVQADLNGSKSVTVSDVIKLRRMIMNQP